MSFVEIREINMKSVDQGCDDGNLCVAQVHCPKKVLSILKEMYFS
jgi:hypothetical protein